MSAEIESDYWLLRSLAQYVSDLNIACEREPVSCDQSSLCITEWCEPCAAKAWLATEKQKEQPRKQVCTCVGKCRGAAGLGEGWVCALASTVCLHESTRTDQGAIVCNVCGETIAP